MLGYCPQIYVMLTAFISEQVYGEECDTGWFGEYCRYRCHCDHSRSCDQSSGECPTDDTCDSGNFGPGCQFVNMVRYETDHSAPLFVRDSDDTTCNPDPKATSVELVQKRPVPLSFIRIVVNDKKNLLNFTMTLNDAVPCSTKRTFIISDTVVDVTCDVTVTLAKLRIAGPMVGSICSVYISGGRNVALRQNTSQGSTSPGGESSKAVDGDNNYCSDTRDFQTPQEWILTFNRPQIIYEVNIVNNLWKPENMRGFRIDIFEQNGSLVFFYEDETTIVRNMYGVTVTSQMPVTTFKLSLPNKKNSLSLCEVLIFGNDVCQESYTYGIYCQHPCQCGRVDVCNVVTGACAPGCPLGFYGFNCSTPCSVNCLEGLCEWRTGYCFPCISGFRGDRCNTECDPGTYGENCTYNCSERCADTCNHIHGTCNCKKEFTGSECKFCAKTFYGEQCENNCSARCLNRLCERYTGMCFACVEGYQGSYCEYGAIIIWIMLIPLVVLIVCLCFFAAIEEREESEE